MVRVERGFLRSRWHQGYLLGSLVGYGAGLATVIGDDEYYGSSFLAAPLLLIAGGIAGSVIGAANKREVWETVQDWTGDPVRITLSGSERVVGVVSKISRDGLVLSLPGGSRLVAAGDVARIERRTVRRQWRQGLVIGAAGGGVYGILMPLGGEDALSALSGEEIAGRMFLAATIGAGYGSEHWSADCSNGRIGSPFRAGRPGRWSPASWLAHTPCPAAVRVCSSARSSSSDYVPGGHRGRRRPVVHGTPASSRRPSSAGRSVSTSRARSG